ncbi:MAG TPA: TIR domain-containing protein, partial [Nitrolancea sp.]|nr:TIR domain-containing protein [Nitrolancea sp.]
MAENARQPYLFVSYASSDRDRVLPIIDRLEAAGVPLWVDREGIGGGASYAQEIAEAIAHAAAVLLLCSPASLASRNVKQEIALAWRHERPYLPLLLEPASVPPDLEYWLEGIQWIEVLELGPDVWLPKVLAALERLGFDRAAVKPPPVPSPQGERRIKLPYEPGALLGREVELAALVGLLRQPDVRLVTLCGPGGIGKTRLAIAAGQVLVDDFAQGVVFVDLATVRDPALVGPAIANALDLQLSGEPDPREQLAAALVHQQLLLILDNFEQVLDAAPLLAELLASTASLKILVTSRSGLQLRAEHEYPVAPLRLPDAGRPLPLAELAASPAVRLFVARAQAVEPGFALTPDNAAAVADICRRLEGIPLALELAAARLRVLPPAALLGRLEHRLALLTGGARDQPARHQTLRDTIAWSYDLLAPAEQDLFARLAVFAGGAPLAGIEAVRGEAEHDDGVLDRLDALLRASLLRRGEDRGDEPRFTMLETIREYATEQLASRPDGQRTYRAHAAFYLALAQAAEPALFGASQAAVLEQLEREHGNLRAALAWLRAGGDAGGALRLATTLWRFWYLRSHLTLGIARLGDLLEQNGAADPALRAKALLGLGALSFKAGTLPRAQAYLEESVRLYRALGDAAGLGWALVFLGHVAGAQHDDAAGYAQVEESLALFRQVGDQAGMARALNALGETSRSAGDDARAESFYAEALALDRAGGNRAGAAIRLHNLGYVDLHRGAIDQAAARFEESLLIQQELGDAAGVAQGVEGLAATAVAVGRCRLAAQLFAAAE